MSAYPPPDDAGNFPVVGYHRGFDQPNPRPTSVTVISIFAIILGSLGLLCNAIGLVTQALMIASGGRNPFMPNLPAMSDTAVSAYGAATSVVNLIISAILLAAGIGGMKLRPLARRAMVALSVFVLGWATVITVVQIVWVRPRTIEYSHQMQARMGTPNAAAVPKGVESGIQIGGAIIGWILWCALPVCVLAFWRSARVIAAFEQPQPPMATPTDPNWPTPSAPQTGL